MDSANHFDIGSDYELQNASLTNETNKEIQVSNSQNEVFSTNSDTAFPIQGVVCENNDVAPNGHLIMPIDLPDTAEPTCDDS